MFPSLRQRLIIAAAVLLGAVCWVLIVQPLRPADGGSGITLLDARIGLATALGLVIVAGLPAALTGLFTSVTGNPLSGIFAVATSLIVLAWWGGPIDGFLRRHAAADALPSVYLNLIAEMFIWQALFIVLMGFIQRLHSPLRTRLPALAFSDHLGVDTHLRLPGVQAAIAGLSCAVIAGGLSVFFLRSSDVGQVTWSLLITFAVGSMASHLLFPQTNPVGILLSPLLVAGLSYAYVAWRFDSTQGVLAGWYNMDLWLANVPRLPGTALALPIHFAAAATAGCALGVGWAQAILGSEDVKESHISAVGGAGVLWLYRKHRDEARRNSDDE